MTDDPNRGHSPVMRLQSALENYYEKRFYASADAIISVSDPIIESIRTRHAKLHLDSKTHTLQNGFDDLMMKILLFQKRIKLKRIFSQSPIPGHLWVGGHLNFF